MTYSDSRQHHAHGPQHGHGDGVVLVREHEALVSAEEPSLERLPQQVDGDQAEDHYKVMLRLQNGL